MNHLSSIILFLSASLGHEFKILIIKGISLLFATFYDDTLKHRLYSTNVKSVNMSHKLLVYYSVVYL